MQQSTPFFTFPEQAYECEDAITCLTASGQTRIHE
jgi:hypothetical protein